MSGFEVAGVVLGAWPIVIGGLKFYAEERGVIKDFNNCQPLVKDIYRQLKREKVVFETSSKRLFNAVAQQANLPLGHVAAMMISPEDLRWTDVQGKDSEGLFSLKTATLYSEARKDIEDVLAKIQESLNKVPPRDENKHTTKRQWQRLLFAIKQDQLDVQLEKAEKLNRFLVELTRETNISSFAEPSRRSAKHYSTVREQAMLMADALQRKLLREKCPCKSRHSASLALEVRLSKKRTKNCAFHVLLGSEAALPTTQRQWITWEAEIQATEGSIIPNPTDFLDQPPTATSAITLSQVIPSASVSETATTDGDSKGQSARKKRSFKRFWRAKKSRSDNVSALDDISLHTLAVTTNITPEGGPSNRNLVVKFEVQDGESEDAKTEEISNLCALITATPMQATVYGLLISCDGRRQTIRRAAKPCCSTENVKMVSLAQILSAGLWETKPRSILGLKLASTVLQLYQTAWLSDDWGKDDIFFIKEEDGTIVTEKPFLRPRTGNIPSRPGTVPATINMNVPCLLALGVVLLELHYKKSIDELQMERPEFAVSDDDSPERSNSKRSCLIWQLIEKMYAGNNFEEVLKRCVGGLDGAWSDINKEELRDMIEEKIIVPLENEVLWLHGSNRIEQCI
ncbi:hypothetical protein VTL71DRAFT_5575 [Oculimacula yallundae]|uniref:DUF7580 domain-containing protein n=1 Tax=Oculimacula yallundae TaxID=86028 RepID=A0ABR4C1J4_9HELO